MERQPIGGTARSIERAHRVVETPGDARDGVQRPGGDGDPHLLGEGDLGVRGQVGHATNSRRSWSHDQLTRTLVVVAYVSAVERREQLIEATIAVLRRSGATAVTSRAIAAEAEAPLASIHYTFGSLDDLVMAAFERLIDEVAARITEGVDVTAGYGPCIVAVMQGGRPVCSTTSDTACCSATSTRPATVAWRRSRSATTGSPTTSSTPSPSTVGASRRCRVRSWHG